MLRVNPTESSILDQLRVQGILLESPCNGKGVCGKCKVRILRGNAGPLTETERSFLTMEEIEQGIRLACMAVPVEPVDLDPLELLKTEHTQVLGSSAMPAVSLQPAVTAQPVPKDREWSGNSLAETILPPEKQPALTLLRSLASLTADTEVEVVSYLGRPVDLIRRTPLWGMAVDLGTTTVSVSLVDLRTGQEVCEDGFVNPQKAFGLDVLSRIQYTLEHSTGIADLQRTIAEALQSCAERLSHQAGGSVRDIFEVSVAGNATMIHLLLGVHPASLSQTPFRTVFRDAVTVPAAQAGLHLHPEAVLYCLPAVSAYIGGDIVAGALAERLDEREDTVFFVDIGTNGEMILCRDHKLVSCSCAAGPALEGMNIGCGMRAAQGAIEAVSLLDDRIELHTIGSGTPKGLCGSGLLDVVSQAVAKGIINKRGRIVPDHPLVCEDANGKRQITLSSEQNISLTQGDIRQVQLCKGAILSGCQCLLDELKLRPEEIDHVLVAGQFGRHLSPESLVGAGLLPPAFASKISYVGNSSRAGATMCLFSQAERQRAQRMARAISYVDLSTKSGYESSFLSCMSFDLRAD